jgi:hypothetical protein
MKLLIIGILVFIIVICHIIKIIDEKGKISKEAFNISNNLKNKRAYLKSMGYYYKNLLKGNAIDEITENIDDTTSMNNFLRFNEDGILVEGAVGGRDVIRNTENDIDVCRSITSCDQLNDYPKCGYCGSTGLFEYAYGKTNNNNPDIGPDVCPADAIKGNQWAKTAYDCNKIQRQKMCSEVTSCTQLDESTDQGRWCAWCPGDSTAKVAAPGKNALLMYDGKRTGEEKSKIMSDTCRGLGEPDPEFPEEGPLFDSLIRSGNCSVCDEPVDGRAVGLTGPHSDACLNSLWQASNFDPSSNLNVTCKTEYNQPNLNEGNALKYNINKPYFKIGRKIKREVHRPLNEFYRDFRDTDSWDVTVSAPNSNNRRSKNINVIDNLWKQCFGKNRKDNDL